MILDLHRQGLSVIAIARRVGRDPKTVRKYVERGLELPAYGPRQVGRPNKLAPFLDYLRERLGAFPDLTATRLTREVRERGYTGAYTAVKRFVAAIRPADGPKPFEVRFETPPGQQAQVDFARFVVAFEDEPGTRGSSGCSRWCSVIPGTSWRLLRPASGPADAAALSHGSLRSDRRRADRDPLRPHEDGGHRRGRSMATSSTIARSWRLPSTTGFHPRACRPYRAKTKGKVERPFSYIRQDFFLARSFRNLEDLNAQLQDWLATRRQCPAAWHDPTDRRGSLRCRAARTAAPARDPLRCAAQARAARQS